MNILITGASGFIGKPVLDLLISNFPDCSILCLTRSFKKNNLKKKRVEWFNCDLNDVSTYKSRIQNFSPDTVIHLAWEGIPDFSLNKSFQNLQNSINFFHIAFECKSVKKIIVTGSCFEYNNPYDCCSEMDSCLSKDYFTWAKNSLRDFLQTEAQKLNIIYCWARLFYVYGPNQRAGSLIPTIINSLNSERVPDIRTPKNANDFIFVDDVASAIINMIENKIPSGIYNLGSGYSTEILEICKICEKIINGTSKLSNQLEIQTQSVLKTVDFWADLDFSKKLLNWKPATDIELGIKRMIEENIKNDKN
jgi:nucleoside-diphosphate-sugar epimerase